MMDRIADLERLRAVLDAAHSALDTFAGLGLQAAVGVDRAGVMALRVNILGGALTGGPGAQVGVAHASAPVPASAPVVAPVPAALVARPEASVVLPSFSRSVDAVRPAVGATGVPRPKKASAVSEGANSHWSYADEAELVRLYEVEGLQLTDIALRLGRSRKGVSVKLTRLRGAGRMTIRRAIVPREVKWSEQEITDLRDLWGTMPEAEVVARMGRTRGAISSMVSRLGLVRTNRGRPRAKDAEQKSEPKVIPPVAVVKVRAPDPAPAPKPAPAPAPIPAPVPKPAPNPVKSHYRPEPVPIVEVAAVPSSPPFTMPKGAGLASAPLRGADFSGPPARFMPGMTDRQKAEVVAAHIAGLAADRVLLATDDLDMCEAVFSGQKIAVWAGLNEYAHATAVARFNAIVAPMRVDGARGLPIEAAAWVLPALRARADGVAA